MKGAQERFSRLGVVSKILRESESRKRYDFFYKNGVPKWRGTGYYYARFRPGLSAVFVFLIILTSGMQYLVQRLNYSRDLARVQSIIQQAKSAAWGNKLQVPAPEGRRKVKVPLGGPAKYDEDGNLISGRAIDMVVEGNDVFFLEPDGSLTLLDESTAVPPSVKRTWFLGLIGNLVSKVTKRESSDSVDKDLEDEDRDESQTEDGTAGSTSDAPGSGTVTPKDGKGGRGAATMAGGRRRKAVRKR